MVGGNRYIWRRDFVFFFFFFPVVAARWKKENPQNRRRRMGWGWIPEKKKKTKKKKKRKKERKKKESGPVAELGTGSPVISVDERSSPRRYPLVLPSHCCVSFFLPFFAYLFFSLSLSLPRRNKTKKKAKEEEENAREYGVYVSLPDPARLAVAFKQ